MLPLIACALLSFSQITTINGIGEIFVKLEPCLREAVQGFWCEWAAWSTCDRATCTRTRRRFCDCPKPKMWNSDYECPTIRPQNDYMNGSKLVRHTRYIRKTTTGAVCQIPYIHKGRYYPDCVPGSEVKDLLKETPPEKSHYCFAGGNLNLCEKNEDGTLAIHGLQELDIGACDGWSASLHRRSSAQDVSRFSYGAESELGRKCSDSSSTTAEPCKRRYFFGQGSYSDFGRLSELAYDIDSCRFACAIRRTCLSIEFIQGVSCTLITEVAPLKREHYPGVMHQSKAEECEGSKELRYPFSEAVAVLESKHD